MPIENGMVVWIPNSTTICLKHIEEIVFTAFADPRMMLGAAAAGC